MSDFKCIPFDSRDLFYKSHFGAVCADTPFTLKVLLKRDGYVKSVTALFDRDGSETTSFELLDDGNTINGDFYTRSAEIKLNEGLYFYKFVMQTNDGVRELLNIGRGIGEFTPCSGIPWQLTVYDKDFETPKEVKGGIIYQIFPDRFFKGKNQRKIPNDRILQKNWNATPFYKTEKTKKLIGKDFFGGNLNGIAEKLDYIKSLSVNIIYLNPIFESQSNHRYDTSNYLKIDPVLGSEKDFENLCKKAKELGIDIILDGVFSHTGNDSIYFNYKKRYKNLGAYNSKKSPYYSWYKFQKYPNEYSCWWGIKTLPEVDETNPSFLKFITGDGGVIDYWMKKGASGFRLDVADELPDEILDSIRIAVKRANPKGLLIGEVWEDATNKISYGKRRRFLRGKQLDSVMNYPFANAIIDFVKGGSGQEFTDTVMQICENYPKPALDCLMNHIGTHDTSRAITRLGGKQIPEDRSLQAKEKITKNQYLIGVKRLKCAALLSYTLPGIPSLYYGDEAGLTGYGDPFCRAAFPWDNVDTELTEFYKALGTARKNCKAFEKGNIYFLSVDENHILFKREQGDSFAIIGVNNGKEDILFSLPKQFKNPKSIFGEAIIGKNIKIPAEGYVFLIN